MSRSSPCIAALALLFAWLALTGAVDPRDSDDAPDADSDTDTDTDSGSDAGDAAPGDSGPTANPNAAANPNGPTITEAIRVVILTKGSDVFVRATNRLVEAPIASDVEVVPTPAYRRYASQVHIRKPFSIAAAQRIAHTAHFTHVVTLTEVRNHQRGDRRRFVEVVVVRLSPKTSVLMAQRFFMPDHKMTPTLAGAIRERVNAALAQPPPPTVADDTAEDMPPTKGGGGVVLKTLAGGAEDKAGGDKGKGKGKDADDSDDDAPGAEATATAHDPNQYGVGRVWGAVGPSIVKRTAFLSAPGSTPPCYCNPTNSNAFANVFLGLRLAGEAFWAATGSAFGIVGDFSITYASTTVDLDGVQYDPTLAPGELAAHSRVISSIALDYSLGGAYRWVTPIDVQVIPMLGVHSFYFPLSDGEFPGLEYIAPWVAVRLHYRFADSMWYVFLQGDVMPFLQARDEAARLGALQHGVGWKIAGGAGVILPWLDISVLLRFEDYGLAFSGETFLYTPIRYNQVSLDDRTGQFVIMAGSHFW